jgi:hypothetical protein
LNFTDNYFKSKKKLRLKSKMWIDKYLIYVSVLCLILLVNVVESTESSNLVDEVLTHDVAVPKESVRDLDSLDRRKRSLLIKRGSRRKLNRFLKKDVKAKTSACTNTDGTLLNSAECGCGSIEKCGCSHGTTTLTYNNGPISDTTYGGYEPLLQTVLTSDVSVLNCTINWKDQGWGYQKGYL